MLGWFHRMSVSMQLLLQQSMAAQCTSLIVYNSTGHKPSKRQQITVQTRAVRAVDCRLRGRQSWQGLPDARQQIVDKIWRIQVVAMKERGRLEEFITEMVSLPIRRQADDARA